MHHVDLQDPEWPEWLAKQREHSRVRINLQSYLLAHEVSWTTNGYITQLLDALKRSPMVVCFMDLQINWAEQIRLSDCIEALRAAYKANSNNRRVFMELMDDLRRPLPKSVLVKRRQTCAILRLVHVLHDVRLVDTLGSYVCKMEASDYIHFDVNVQSQSRGPLEPYRGSRGPYRQPYSGTTLHYR